VLVEEKLEERIAFYNRFYLLFRTPCAFGVTVYALRVSEHRAERMVHGVQVDIP